VVPRTRFVPIEPRGLARPAGVGRLIHSTAEGRWYLVRDLSIDDLSRLVRQDRQHRELFGGFIPRQVADFHADPDQPAAVEIPELLGNLVIGPHDNRRDWALARIHQWESAQHREELSYLSVVRALAQIDGFGLTADDQVPWALGQALRSDYAESRELAREVVFHAFRQHHPDQDAEEAMDDCELLLERAGHATEMIEERNDPVIGDTIVIPDRYIARLTDPDAAIRRGNMRFLTQRLEGPGREFVLEGLARFLSRAELRAEPARLMDLIGIATAALSDRDPSLLEPFCDRLAHHPAGEAIPELIRSGAVVRAALATPIHLRDLRRALDGVSAALAADPDHFQANWAMVGADVAAAINATHIPHVVRNAATRTAFEAASRLPGPLAEQARAQVAETFDNCYAQAQRTMAERRRAIAAREFGAGPADPR